MTCIVKNNSYLCPCNYILFVWVTRHIIDSSWAGWTGIGIALAVCSCSTMSLFFICSLPCNYRTNKTPDSRQTISSPLSFFHPTRASLFSTPQSSTPSSSPTRPLTRSSRCARFLRLLNPTRYAAIPSTSRNSAARSPLWWMNSSTSRPLTQRLLCRRVAV